MKCHPALFSIHHLVCFAAFFFTAADQRAAASNEPGSLPSTIANGVVHEERVPSPALGKDLSYFVYFPAGYDSTQNAEVRYPVIYLLHGRGDTMKAWLTVQADFDDLIASGKTPAFIAVMPDAPSNQHAGYYIDSLFAGTDKAENSAGAKVETAFTTDLVEHVDATYRTLADRKHRIVGGYSMGGYGALRYSLAYPELFGAAIVLSPAVYFPVPPPQSSTREFGAFGRGSALFEESIYRAKNYPAILASFTAARLPLFMFIAVGDDEVPQKDAREASHDLDFEAHTLYNVMRRVPRIHAQLRVVDGGHNWDTWRPTFNEGARYVFRMLERKADFSKSNQ